MSFEHFRVTLELLVDPADPRKEYTDFVKIGEGSTGNVYTARHVSTNQVVAVKKMDIRKQQRRELLFNEVSPSCMCLLSVYGEKGHLSKWIFLRLIWAGGIGGGIRVWGHFQCVLYVEETGRKAKVGLLFLLGSLGCLSDHPECRLNES
jgi:serine/threonine protein kinase